MGTRKLMRGADAVWLRLERSDNPAEVVAMLVFEERLRRDRLRALIDERLLRFERLRSRVVRWRGRFAWEVEREFSIDRHLRWYRLGDGAIETKLHELAAAPLDPAHPLWRFDVVDLPDHSVLIAKVHHSLGDGFAQIALLLALVDEELPIDKRPMSSERGRLRIRRMLRTSFKLTALPPDPATALKRRLSGPQRFAWTKGVSLEAVRAEAHRRGIKINDLLIAILTRALAETIGPSDVRAVVPVNLRGPRSEALGNRFGLVLLPLPLHAPSLDESAHLVSRAMRRLKQRHEAVAAAALLGVLGLLPKWLAFWGARFFARKASLVVTNVPGPQEALHVGGIRLAHVHFWVPHPATLGLGVSILSYAGEVRMGVRADAAVLPDPTQLVRRIERELDHVLWPPLSSMPGDWKEGAPSWNA